MHRDVLVGAIVVHKMFAYNKEVVLKDPALADMNTWTF